MNPFRILNIDPSTTRPEIVKAAALAMRERRHPARDIAIAQKELLNPVANAVHQFVNVLDIETLKRRCEIPTLPARPGDEIGSSLEHISILGNRR